MRLSIETTDKQSVLIESSCLHSQIRSLSFNLNLFILILLRKKFEAFFSQVHTMTMHYKCLTTALQCIKTKKPNTLAGFKPGIIRSVGGHDDHYANAAIRALFN
jgi:hypothetical protein